jgi:hypothetical protein
MNNIKKCNFNSEFAYILNNKDDELVELINISDYLKNKNLQKEIKNGAKYLFCQERHELIKYESITKIRKDHFKHKINKYGSMTDWHKEWQSNFKNIEVHIGNNIVDALVNNNILEFQHSYISEEDINNRKNNAINNNKILNWIIDCNNSIEINKIGNIYMIYFYNDEWNFSNFTCHDFIFLNFEDKIYKINPSEVKSNMIDVIEYKTKIEFINSMKNNINIWSEEKIPQCILYHNQRGAGCGKTYESIQLMDKDIKFKHKEIFIYLTKAHTAKDVIYNELLEQYSRGSLSNLEMPKEYRNDSGKQYKIKYYNKETAKKCRIIIGTIDSFMWAIGNKNHKDKDYFEGIVDSIKNGFVGTSKKGTIKYSQDNIILNKKCLIIIDEAQDLGPKYIEAVCSIMRNTYVDAYIIGDKLQSIWGEHNIHTFLEFNDLPHITIKTSVGINHVMRFHNEQFKDFVNGIIDFKKYNLSSITQICNNTDCKYKHDNIKPYNLFQVPTIYTDDRDGIKIDKLILEIINYMKKEINIHNYLPNNFMFIFPILSKNALANRLEAKIQDFWIEKFSDKNYQNTSLINNEYWREKIKNEKYHKYVFLHKSDEGKSIDLRESENATRILSIHASKGNGCEVVFLLGLTQSSLQRFSNDKCNLQYDSLLHVAITRQKKSLYIGIENNGDDISQKFSKYNIDFNAEIKPKLNEIKKSTKYNSIIGYTFILNNIFENINNKYIDKLEIKLQDDQTQTNIIEWGHHIIRYCAFYYHIVRNIINSEKMVFDNYYNDQYVAILTKISKLNIEVYDHIEYYRIIKKEMDKIFPILIFSACDKTVYYKYKDILYSFIIKIQKKIEKGIDNRKLPVLCPLETVILIHMINLYQDKQFSATTIMDVYSIIYYFDECSSSINEDHYNNYKCLCNTKFPKNNNINIGKYPDIKNSIINHYNKIEKVNILYANYKKYISENMNDSYNFDYNINHPVVLYRENKNFKISSSFEIIANSDKYVIYFIIKPQFNKLNFNEIILASVFKNYLLMNSCITHKNNYERFKNKIIYTCILSLDSIEPLFINLNIDENCDIIKNSIKEYLLKEYSDKHKIVYTFYLYCKKNKPNGIDSIRYTYDEILKHNDSLTYDSSEIPKYIENYFYSLSEEIRKCNKNRIKINDVLIKIDTLEIFLENIKEYLVNAINEYTDNSNDNDNDEIDY